MPGQPGTGYAALRVPPDVTRLAVGLRDGHTLALCPVPVQGGHDHRIRRYPRSTGTPPPRPRTAYLVARLSDGRPLRIRPAQVGGRQYVALALPAGLTLTEVTGYDRAGRPIARW